MDSLSDSSDQETEVLFGVGAFPQLPKAVITIANFPVETVIDSGASLNREAQIQCECEFEFEGRPA